MKTTTKNTGIKVTTGVKGGSLGTLNHNGSALKVRAGLKAGMTIQSTNHNRMGLKVRSTLKAGKTIQLTNHNTRLLALA